MKFNKIYNRIIESASNLPVLTADREVYAVWIMDTHERETGNLQEVSALEYDFFDYSVWDNCKLNCTPLNFHEALKLYCNYLQKYKFDIFNDHNNLPISEVISKVISDAKKYSHIKGEWYFYGDREECIFGIEVDVRGYRTGGITDAVVDQIEGEDISNW